MTIISGGIMDKKPYEAPTVKKVSLDIQSSVLAVCRSSTIADPLDYCHELGYCAYP